MLIAETTCLQRLAHKILPVWIDIQKLIDSHCCRACNVTLVHYAFQWSCQSCRRYIASVVVFGQVASISRASEN